MSEKRLEELDRLLKKLIETEGELDALKRQAGNFRAVKLQRLAKRIGFELVGGKEPVWEHPEGFTTAIPNHPTDLGKGLAIKIIKTLQGHIFLIRAPLEDEQDKLRGTRSTLSSRRGDDNYGY